MISAASSLVLNNARLVSEAHRLGLGDLLVHGLQEVKSTELPPEFLASTFKALVAAIYKGLGPLYVRKFVHRHFLSRSLDLSSISANPNPKLGITKLIRKLGYKPNKLEYRFVFFIHLFGFMLLSFWLTCSNYFCFQYVVRDRTTYSSSCIPRGVVSWSRPRWRRDSEINPRRGACCRPNRIGQILPEWLNRIFLPL